MQIVCVRQGDKYTDEDVNLLYRQCRECEPKAKFICLSDRYDHEPETVKLNRKLHGWWAKMELFAPWNEQYRPYLYFDLDTLILGPLGDIWTECKDEFWQLENFYDSKKNAACMMWIPKNVDHIWKEFDKDPSKIIRSYRSDQEFLNTFPYRKFQDLFQGHLSYKGDQLQLGPRDAVTVHFHGKPKAKDLKAGWIKRHLERFSD